MWPGVNPNKCKISEFSQVKPWKLVKLVDQSNKTSEPIEPYAPGKASEVSDSINNNQGTIELAVAGNYIEVIQSEHSRDRKDYQVEDMVFQSVRNNVTGKILLQGEQI